MWRSPHKKLKTRTNRAEVYPCQDKVVCEWLEGRAMTTYRAASNVANNNSCHQHILNMKDLSDEACHNELVIDVVVDVCLAHAIDSRIIDKHCPTCLYSQ